MLVKSEKPVLIHTAPKVTGILYYIYEYYHYLKITHNLDFNLIIISSLPKTKIKQLYKNKYKEVLDFDYYYLNDQEIWDFYNHFYFYAPGYLILDAITFKNPNIFLKGKILYNYGNAYNAASKYPLKLKKVITFGDQELNLKLDYHFPLSLNFPLFKEIKEFKNKAFIENKQFSVYNVKNSVIRSSKFNDHSEFNKLIYYKKNYYDRANRMILESAWYQKNIEVYNHDSFLDSINLRCKSIIENTFKEKYNLLNSRFSEFVKAYLCD